jgi:hypothetical protein
MQKMKRRSRPTSPNSCPGTSKDRPRAGAAAAGRLDSDEGAQGDAVLDMADLEEELSQIDPYTTMPAHTPKGPLSGMDVLSLCMSWIWSERILRAAE